jgi:hypothetical protein
MGIGAIVIGNHLPNQYGPPDTRTSPAHSLPRLAQPEEHEEKVGQHLKTTNISGKKGSGFRKDNPAGEEEESCGVCGETRQGTSTMARQVQGPRWRSRRIRLETKQAALDWGRDQEAKVRGHTWNDPKAGQITVGQWIDRWKAKQDVGLSTTDNREYLIGRFIRPYWGARQLNSLTGEEITVWENGLPTAAAVSHRTAKDARRPFEVLLAAERAALLSGRDDEFRRG